MHPAGTWESFMLKALLCLFLADTSPHSQLLTWSLVLLLATTRWGINLLDGCRAAFRIRQHHRSTTCTNKYAQTFILLPNKTLQLKKRMRYHEKLMGQSRVIWSDGEEHVYARVCCTSVLHLMLARAVKTTAQEYRLWAFCYIRKPNNIHTDFRKQQLIGLLACRRMPCCQVLWEASKARNGRWDPFLASASKRHVTVPAMIILWKEYFR